MRFVSVTVVIIHDVNYVFIFFWSLSIVLHFVSKKMCVSQNTVSHTCHEIKTQHTSPLFVSVLIVTEADKADLLFMANLLPICILSGHLSHVA